MMKRWTILLLLLILSGIQSVYGQQQVARVLDGNPYIGGYYEYLPGDYASNTTARYPLLVFFHGLGEEGNGTTDITRVLRHGPPKLINQGTFPKTFTVNGQTFSFIVISPQTKTLADNKSILQFLTTLKEKYRVDESRIYLTGLSKGGWQVWQWASGGDAEAKLPAAIVPVCGAMNPYYEYVAAPIARNNLPVWATHNDMDPTVNVVNTYNWIKFINAYVPAANPQAKMTIFQSASHDAWTKTYDPNFRENGLNIYEWMLQYKTAAVNPPPPVQTAGNKRITLTKNFGNGINYPNAMTQLNIQPGDTLCIPAGDYSTMLLGNITGTPEKPVVIQNCGGLVRFGINNTAAGGTITVNFSTCKYIEFSGSGTPGLEYGFDIKGSNDAGASQFGVYFLAGSSDFDAHHLYIHDAGIFIVAKTLQACTNSQYHDGNFVMRNVKIHKIKGRRSQWEGFYIGNSHYVLTAAETGCGDLRSHRIENIDVYDNDLEDMGQDGIQLSLADKGTNKIRGNRVVNYGTAQNVQHSYGILVGGGSKLDVFNNRVDKGFSANICVFGSGVNRIFNNVLTNSGIEGILVADRLIFEPTTAYIYNNTILNSKTHAVTVYATQTTLGHKVYNNLTIKQGTIYDAPLAGYYIKGDNIKFEAANNINYATAEEAGFANLTAGDYHLLATSKAIDAGRDMTDQGLTTDFDNKPRPNNGKYDAGAYEFNAGAPPPPNTPPVANAGANVTLTLPADSVQLDGTASRDADGTITGWSWTKASGPASGTIVTPAANKTMVRGLSQGTYVFTLTVTDNAGGTATANVTVTVNAAPVANKPPVANAGSGATITLPTNSLQLDGSASTDPDGSITAWSWTKQSGPAATIGTPNAAKTTVTGLSEGVYVFALTVTDNSSATATAEVTITVNAAPAQNTAPVAHAGFNTTIVLPVNSAQLDGSASQDVDGTIASYAWKQLGGPAGVTIASPAAAKTTVSGFTLEGAYVFELTVTDDKGAVNSSNVTVTVSKSISTNKPPVANAGPAPTITLPASVVTVDGTGSTDPDGSIVAYKWTKVSGSPGGNITSSTSAKTTIYDLYIAGEYYYQLRVTDNAGDTASALVKIVVNLPVNNPPVARAGNDITITLPTNSVVLDGRTSTDEDGNLATYLWKKISGPAAGTITAPGASYTTVTGLEAGTYEYELTVTDKAGAASSDRVLVTVNASPKPPNKPPVARAGNNATITLPTSSVSLDGRASTDEDGTIASYSWKKISGPAAGTISTPDGNYTTVTGLTTAGTYVYELTVQDNGSAVSTAQVTVTVNPAVQPDNRAPAAATQGDVVLQLPTATTTFNGSASSDPDGFIAAYEWKQLSGPNTVQIWEADKAKTNVTGFDRGEYIFQLTVRDDRGSSNVTSFRVSVLASKNGDADTASLMPNPATTFTRLDMTRKGAHQVNVYILELSGRVVRQVPASFVDRLQMTLDVQQLPKGFYLVSVKGQGVKWAGKLMVAGQ